MVSELRKKGHDIFDLKEEGLDHLSDSEVFLLAQDKRRILITMDKDFSNILLYPPGDHFGIIVVKLYRFKVTEASKIFIDTINNLDPQDIATNLVIIDRNKTRIRKEKLIKE
jgi:predicted nuclease of predicted toxin-antitoxin system